MAISLKRRFSDEGIPPETIAREIKKDGLLPTSQARDCSVEALGRYAKDVLGIDKPLYVTKLHYGTSEAVERGFWTSLFDYVDAIKAENVRLAQELSKERMREQEEVLEVKERFIELTNNIDERTRAVMERALAQ